MKEQTKKYGTPEDLQKEYGLNPRTLANERSLKRGIPYRKLGRKVLYKISDVERYIESQTVLTTDSIKN